MAGLTSVIVPTRNSAATIDACLASIGSQTYPELELIVVDNSSSDDTVKIAERQANLVFDKAPERTAQRNAGAAAANGDFLMFIDSDMNLEPTVVSQCVELASSGAQSVIVPETSFGIGFWARCKTLERSCYVGDDAIEAARFFTRDVFDACEGYDPQLPIAGEDWDLHRRVRERAGAPPRTRSYIHHDEGKVLLRETLATKFYYGKAFEHYIRKHGRSASDQLTPFRSAYLRHWRRLARHPVLMAGMVVMKACEIGAGAAGLVAARLTNKTAEAG